MKLKNAPLTLLTITLGIQYLSILSMATFIEKKIAVVTGSNKGIGYEIAKKMSAAGCKTIMACRNPELGEEAAQSLRSNGLDVEFRQLDISDFDSIHRFSQEFSQEFGKCNILVNNAAIAFKGSDPTPFQQQAAPTFHTNYFGTLELTNHMLPFLKKTASPRIVNVASMTGHLRILPTAARRSEFSNPALTIVELDCLVREFVTDVEKGVHREKDWPNSCYGMSKLAVIAMTKVLGRDNPEVAVTSCCPGYCDTDMSSHRGPRPPEVGARTPAMLALMSPEDAKLSSGKFFSDEHEEDW